MPEFVSQISGLRNHDLAGVDSRREAREATFGEARWAEDTPKSENGGEKLGHGSGGMELLRAA